MKVIDGRKRLGPSELTAYGSVGAAILFIFALTFGLFDHPPADRQVASNASQAEAVSTP
ncbi:hypothetical protein GCM10011390_04510 [Aureimonas endophytica]|uniref:Uncharacterized protein n=1 Tax=Aureimonas endophytica TaxID=2027858 RepID=A0A917E1F1_9HYPH|nr:hypothetical protein [Aureimonas endophytica]GGD88843.1 hypothetical protein GCM10011390_04510 [Aureimonas endophytica]